MKSASDKRRPAVSCARPTALEPANHRVSSGQRVIRQSQTSLCLQPILWSASGGREHHVSTVQSPGADLLIFSPSPPFSPNNLKLFACFCFVVLFSSTSHDKNKLLSTALEEKTETVNPSQEFPSRAHTAHRVWQSSSQTRPVHSGVPDNIRAADRSSVSARRRLTSVETHRPPVV